MTDGGERSCLDRDVHEKLVFRNGKLVSRPLLMLLFCIFIITIIMGSLGVTHPIPGFSTIYVSPVSGDAERLKTMTHYVITGITTTFLSQKMSNLFNCGMSSY